MAARVRVFVPTYRRPLLLERALRSLIDQTFENWIAEVHNDDPDDSSPAALIARIDDPRIYLVQHKTNWGALKTFNEFFHAQNDEEFVGLLEDDNAWEAEFLSRLIQIMDSDPVLALVWCNQSLDEETEDGHVSPMKGRTAREMGCSGWLASGKYKFGHPAQALGALHANGAMLLRTRRSGPLQTPPSIPFTGVEGYRERMLTGPLYYTDEPLARFSVTKTSARGGEGLAWAQFQTGLLASFLLSRPKDAPQVLNYARSLRPAATGVFITACLGHPALRIHLRGISLGEWLRLGLTAIRRPTRVRAGLAYQEAAWWADLLEATKQE